MSEHSSERDSFETLLRDSFRDGECPAPEVFLELEHVPTAERKRIEAHAADCPACRAEQRLAAAFAQDAESVPAEDEDYVISKMRAAQQTTGAVEASNVVPLMPSGARSTTDRAAQLTASRRRWIAVPLAAAAAVVLGMAILLRTGGGLAPPDLPAIDPAGVFRGTTLEVIGPSGDLATSPESLHWHPVADADHYQVQLVAVDDTVLWSAAVNDSSAHLPQQAREQLHPAVSYAWRVDALDGNGQVLRKSALVHFRIPPDVTTEH